MRKRILTTLTISLIFPFATFATTTHSGYVENQSEAYFSLVQGCEDVVVGVSVVETDKIIHGAPIPPTQAFVFGTFNNICDIGSSYSFAEVITLNENEFSQKRVNSSYLKLTKNIGGFDVVINLKWNGVGKTEKYKNKIRTNNNGIIVRDSDVILSRAADKTGTFTVNGIDYAIGTQTGGLSVIKAHTVEKTK